MPTIATCPWCDETFDGKKYPCPRSAHYEAAISKKKEHLKKEHSRKYKEYRNILKIWEEKVFQNKSFFERYKDIFNDILGNLEGQSAPNHKIIEEYDPEELKTMSEKELRKIIQKF
jgi:hypothetical protein